MKQPHTHKGGTSIRKQIVILGIFTILVWNGLSGCTEEKTVVEGTGTIIFNDSEGGFYGIEADTPLSNYQTNHIDPKNLSQEFQEDGLILFLGMQTGLEKDVA